MRRRHSLRVWMTASLGGFCLLLGGITAYVLYELDLRKHDYQILNLTGQMRVIATSLEQQANRFLGRGLVTARDLDSTFTLFEQASGERLVLYDRIIAALAERTLPADLIGRDEPLQCNWDHQSRSQLDFSVEAWRRYKQGLDGVRGSSVATAAYMAAAGPDLVASTEALAHAFQAMMEGKLLMIRLLVGGMLAGAVVMTAGLLLAMRRSVLAPLDATVAAFRRVAGGDLGFQVPEAATSEIGGMTHAFNELSSRLSAVFSLTERIGRGASVDETLAFIGDGMSGFLPVDWVGLLVAAPDRTRFSVERASGEGVGAELDDPGLGPSVAAAQPVPVSAGEGGLAEFLRGLSLRSAMLLPLPSVRDGGAALLVGAKAPDAYGAEHRQFLETIAAHVDSQLSRTMVMEGLVVAAVQGLAKLAESRDPETGDHLVRMSLYSAFIAEELGRGEAWRDVVTPDYVRAVYRFAPMHDIGKVGIPDHVLLKPGRLDEAERAEMNRHPSIGAEVLRLCDQRMNELGRSVFGIGIEIAEAHHEKWDGSGYPHGLAGDAIPLSARIVAVADVFDALTSKRPYKEAWSVEKALAALRADAGGHFDPAVVAAFERTLPKALEVYERLKHVA